jgi:hypothetical protein
MWTDYFRDNLISSYGTWIQKWIEVHVHDIAALRIRRQKQIGDIGELGEGPDMDPWTRSAKGGSKETGKSTYSRHRSRESAEQAPRRRGLAPLRRRSRNRSDQCGSASLLGATALGSCWDLWGLGFGWFIYTWMQRLLSHLGGPDCARPNWA